MPQNLTVNGNNYAYPIAGDEPGWGEDATAWAAEVTNVLSDIQGIDDIPETTFIIANNTTASADVVGLVFNPTTVRSATVTYSVYRSTDTTELAEKGTLELVFKNGGTPGSKWTIGQVYFGDDSGVRFSMTDAGQIQYTSSDISGSNYSGEIRFEAAVTQQ